jgi:hypothetical protein
MPHIRPDPDLNDSYPRRPNMVVRLWYFDSTGAQIFGLQW